MKIGKNVIVIAIAVLIMGMMAFLEPVDAAVKKKIVGPDQAKAIALKESGLKASGIRGYRIKYDSEDRTYEIHFYRKKNCARYAYDIARVGGIILERDVDYKYRKCSSKKKIGAAAARNSVTRVTKVDPKIIRAAKCEYRYRNREGTYQIRFRLGNRMYEYEILAYNGKIKEIEYKYIGKK